MSTDSGTPRTDALCAEMFYDNGPMLSAPRKIACPEADAARIAEHARTLEREAAALRAELEQWKGSGKMGQIAEWRDKAKECESLRAERDEHASWHAALTEMLHQTEAKEAKLRADRDALAVALSDCLGSIARCDELSHNSAMMNGNAVLAAHGGKP